ncbi:MAG: transcriptional repressor LexA [Oscillospiraceae bacterium]|nr:transcriptional repressor LexA [Oscillospiraceae bacterium]
MEKVDKRREKIYSYILSRINTGSAPTVREICADIGVSSTSTVHSDLKALCLSGLIEMTGGLNRTIRLPGMSAVRVPLLGTVAAGTPILALQNIEQYIPVGIPNASSKELFALRVKGDSMRDAAILNGDIVVVERENTAENGRIIVAMLDDEATVKRYFKEKGHIRLQPENSEMEPIIVDSIEILGRVLFVQRMYP